MIEYERFKDNFELYREHFVYYRDKVLDHVENELYRHRRYGVEFAAMLLYGDEPLDLDVCATTIRQSDNIYALEENLFLVVFDHVDAADAIKAAQNFLHDYRNKHLQKTVYTSVAPIEQDETAIDIASRLFIVLEYALKKSLSNCVVDMSQMRM